MLLTEQLAQAREEGDEFAVAQLLFDLIEETPLFAGNLEDMSRWIDEAHELGRRTVLTPIQEVMQSLRSSEIFLAKGSPSDSLGAAARAGSRANELDLPGLEDRALMVEARALVRVRRQDDAIHLFESLKERQTPDDQDNQLMPGLAYLAVGEAHLFEERYDGAYRPLEMAIQTLPAEKAADRLRFDALLGLGMLDHRMGEFETTELRYAAAMKLADAHESRSEQVESALLLGSICRGRGNKAAAHKHLKHALKLAGPLSTVPNRFSFATERLRNLVGSATVGDLLEAATTLAGECGADGDLMGYVQLTAIVAALTELDQSTKEAINVLKGVAATLGHGGHADAALVLERHVQGYKD